MTCVRFLHTIVRTMDTSFAMPASLGEALLGKARCAVLTLLLGHPDQSYYLREVARLTGLAPGSVQRELASLVRLGLALRVRRGNQVHFRANPDSPIFAELRGMLTKTSGLAEALRQALSPLAEQVTLAFVYGSLAQGTATAASDVDVMVVGDVSFGDVVEALAGVEERLGREVNPTVCTAAEARRRLAAGERFWASVWAAPRILLWGDPHDLVGTGN